MDAFTDHDAALVAHGIRLGGKGDALNNALHAAGEPLTVSHLERIARPDMAPEATEDGQAADGFEHVGMLKMAHTEAGYVIASRWFGWLPGTYATRNVALAAYGYVLGGEGYGHLEDLVKRWGSRGVTAEDVQGLPAR